MTAPLSTFGLLQRSVDYAGTFPPATLPLSEAVANYAQERSGPRAWLLGRLVVSASGLDALETLLPQPTGDEHEISVILSGDPLPQLARVAAFNQQGVGRARVVSVEYPPAAATDIARLTERSDPSLLRFFETPLDADLESRLDAIAKARAAAKVRTGGTVATAIPEISAVSRFLHGCATRGLAFKATAGLHHAIRNCYSLTYERDSATAVMHGFLNVSVAAALARRGAPPADIEEALAESSAGAFEFGPDGLVYRHYAIGLQDLADTRRHFFRSFGSCSFREPADELAALHLL